MFSLAEFVELAATSVTAVATIVLAILTAVLASATKNMARASSEAHIVATFEINQWSLRHFDLVLCNAGNGPAYNVSVSISPDVTESELRKGRALPFQNVSLMRPGQILVTSLAEYDHLKTKTFTVTTRWQAKPKGKVNTLSYDLNTEGYAGLTRLGSRSPEIQIADEIKKLRNDWKNVASGVTKLRSDVYDAQDRKREREDLERMWDEQRPTSDKSTD